MIVLIKLAPYIDQRNIKNIVDPKIYFILIPLILSDGGL